MFKYPLKEHKNTNKLSLPKLPVLHMYIPYTTTQTLTQGLVAKIPSLTCVHTLYTNININTKYRCQNPQSYMCTYPLQQHKYKQLPTTSPTTNPSEDPSTLPSRLPIGIPSTGPSIVPITLPSHKPSSYHICVPGSTPTTNQSQVARKNNPRISIYSPIIETL